MSDPSEPLQDAIETALRSSAALKAAMGLSMVRLYTVSAPNAAPFPYVVIGDDQILDDSTECSDSSEAYTTVHCWSRVEVDVAASRRQIKRMAKAVRAALKTLPDFTGFRVTVAEFEGVNHLIDRDGLTAHSVVSHRFLLDPT